MVLDKGLLNGYVCMYICIVHGVSLWNIVTSDAELRSFSTLTLSFGQQCVKTCSSYWQRFSLGVVIWRWCRSMTENSGVFLPNVNMLVAVSKGVQTLELATIENLPVSFSGR